MRVSGPPEKAQLRVCPSLSCEFHTLRSSANYCPLCGSRLRSMNVDSVCPNCHNNITFDLTYWSPTGSRLCAYCGERLEGTKGIYEKTGEE